MVHSPACGGGHCRLPMGWSRRYLRPREKLLKLIVSGNLLQIECTNSPLGCKRHLGIVGKDAAHCVGLGAIGNIARGPWGCHGNS
jgi:hypothetical protein